MTTSNLIITGCELIASVLLVVGYLNENKIIQAEQKATKKIKKTIYNFIVKLEG